MGKFYYDLLEERENLEREDIALVRIEQLFPLHLEKFKKQSIDIQMRKTMFGHKKNLEIWVLGVLC